MSSVLFFLIGSFCQCTAYSVIEKETQASSSVSVETLRQSVHVLAQDSPTHDRIESKLVKKAFARSTE